MLYKSVSESTNEDEQLVSDIISFSFEQLRKKMESLNEFRINILNIGKFEASKKRIDDEIKRMEKKKRNAKSFDTAKFYDEEINKLVSLKDKWKEDDERKEQSELRKLQWHKENGDPYGVYKKQLEKNFRGIQELIDQE